MGWGSSHKIAGGGGGKALFYLFGMGLESIMVDGR